MRSRIVIVAMVVACLVPSIGNAEEDAGAPKLSESEYCRRTRPPRVESVQIRTREWLKRLADMRTACTAGWVKTGAVIVDGKRVYPEKKGDVKCPKGPPPGETKESVWAALSLFLEDAPSTDETMTVRNAELDAANERCVAPDAASGVVLRGILVNDLPGLRKILAWKK